jgi:hypothetical protein
MPSVSTLLILLAAGALAGYALAALRMRQRSGEAALQQSLRTSEAEKEISVLRDWNRLFM